MSHPHIDGFLPPAGFVLVSSALDGVAVYAPADRDDPSPTAQTRCVRCGASVAFDPSRRALHCTHCGEEELLASAPKGEVEEEFTPCALSRGEVGWGAVRPELHCDGCGADLTIDADHLALACPFCGSGAVVMRQAVGTAIRPGFVVPFQIADEEANAAAASWLRRGWMRPRAVVKEGRTRGLTGVYLPFWVFDANLVAPYEVEVGKRRWVTETDANGNPRRRSEMTWSWHRGEVRLTSGPVVVPGTTRVQGLENLSFPVGAAVPYAPNALVGFAAHAHSVPLADAWATGRHQMRESAAVAAERDAGGDAQRNLQLSVDLQQERWRYVLMPVWVASTLWQGKSYTVLVNGVDGEAHGHRPVSWTKVYVGMAATLTPGLFTGLCVGLPTLPFAGFGILVWVVAVVLLAFGAFFALRIHRAALEEEGLGGPS